jgi:hypothetical protein
VAILSFAGLQAHSFFVLCLEDAGLKAGEVERSLRNPHRSACEIPAKQGAAELLFHGLNGGVSEEAASSKPHFCKKRDLE